MRVIDYIGISTCVASACICGISAMVMVADEFIGLDEGIFMLKEWQDLISGLITLFVGAAAYIAVQNQVKDQKIAREKEEFKALLLFIKYARYTIGEAKYMIRTTKEEFFAGNGEIVGDRSYIYNKFNEVYNDSAFNVQEILIRMKTIHSASLFEVCDDIRTIRTLLSLLMEIKGKTVKYTEASGIIEALNKAAKDAEEKISSFCIAFPNIDFMNE